MQSVIEQLTERMSAVPGFDPSTFDPTRYVQSMQPEQIKRLLDHEAAYRHWRDTNQLQFFFPDDGPYRRELYPKHLSFFKAGADYSERSFMAGNQIGKTTAGGFECALHLTGQYPGWWEGRRFKKGITAWVAGDTYATTRDILQHKLFGNVVNNGPTRGFDGTGMVPLDNIGKIVWHTGVPDLADTISVRWGKYGQSKITLKSYDQGRKVFQGKPVDFIWLDEEPGFDVYGECLVRLITTKGSLILTFTPLKGLTETALAFTEGTVDEG
ncbi:MAG: terminase family protein [Pseudomonadota bacterium]